jgi:peroxiredoxin
MTAIIDKRRSEGSDRLFLVIFLAISLAINVYQFRAAREYPRPPSQLQTGLRLNTIPAMDLNGKVSTIQLNHGRQPTLIYIFSPICHFCEQNFSAMQTLMSDENANYTEIGISLSSLHLSEYLANHPIRFPVYSVSPKTAADLGLIYTPETILIDQGGRVAHTWVGIYSGDTRDDIENSLHIKLPESTASDPNRNPKDCPHCDV